MGSIFSRLRFVLLAGVPLCVVAGLYLGRTTVSPQRSAALPGGAAPECPGWPGQVIPDQTALEAVSTPGWLALSRGAPQVAIHEFQAQAELSVADRAGLLRAWVEWARALWAARELAFAVERLQLDAELAGGLEAVSGREVVPFLRAVVALQSGEAVDVGPWLNRIPKSSPLARAREVLRKVAREPLASRSPAEAPGSVSPAIAAGAVTRWMRHVDGYATALEGLERCPVPYPGAAGARARILADWAGREHLPDPAAWASLLGLQPPNQTPDFALGQCDGEDAAVQVGMYDSSLYTALAGLAMQQVERLEASGPLARFARLQALVVSDPGRARTEACALEQAWVRAPEEDSRPWLVFGDWQDVAEMKAWTRQLCATGQTARCPESLEAWEAALEREQTAAGRCYRSLAARDPNAGELAERWQLYGGIIRRRQLEPFLVTGCPVPGMTRQVLATWRDRGDGEGRWQSLETLFALVRSELGTPRVQEGAHTMYALSTGDPGYGSIFHPLSEVVRYTSGLGLGAGERVYN